MSNNVYDLIIIGAGPAGMSAGIYASRLNLKTLLVTKSFGGQVSSKAVAIENYPGIKSIQGSKLVKKMEEHLKSFNNINIELDKVVKIEKPNKIFIVSAKEKKYKSNSVIIASGAESRKLNIPGEKEFEGRGVSYCSVCDGPLFKNKTVAIIGGGNAGFETALFLTEIAKKIYILEYSQEPKAFEQIQKSVISSKKVKIITQAEVIEIRGDKLVNSLVFKNKESNQKEILEIQGVFVETGYVPSADYAKELVDFDKLKEIEVEFETMQTKTPGLFAAGDVNAGQFKQIVTAASEGAKAALSAHNYIKHKKIEK